MHSDAGYSAGAIENHAAALRLATAEGDTDAMSCTWNNVGLVMSETGQNELAVTCFEKAVALVAKIEGPVFIRCAALSNLSHSRFQLGQYEAGLADALLALGAETGPIREQHLHGAIFLRRNLVSLLVG